jgi:hypothetical protein
MKLSQKNLIREHLKTKSISPMTALEKYGCFRLAARISELREEDLDIETIHTTINGKTFATYRMKP